MLSLLVGQRVGVASHGGHKRFPLRFACQEVGVDIKHQPNPVWDG